MNNASLFILHPSSFILSVKPAYKPHSVGAREYERW